MTFLETHYRIIELELLNCFCISLFYNQESYLLIETFSKVQCIHYCLSFSVVILSSETFEIFNKLMKSNSIICVNMGCWANW